VVLVALHGGAAVITEVESRSRVLGRLRRALNRGRAADPIRTVRGAGYSFDERFGKQA
jgi:DNA-binding response OmpR family regulator